MAGETKRGKVNVLDSSVEGGTSLKDIKADVLHGCSETVTSILFFKDKRTDAYREVSQVSEPVPGRIHFQTLGLNSLHTAITFS